MLRCLIWSSQKILLELQTRTLYVLSSNLLVYINLVIKTVLYLAQTHTIISMDCICLVVLLDCLVVV
nr:MAG TPA: hypothetical protein [Caudoviricetes sp.]